jgi:hypothetical protein
MRPDAMQLEVTLGCAIYGSHDPTPLDDGTEVPGEPKTIKISGRFGDLDPLSLEDAAIVLPKLAYLFEGLVKEHNARKQAEMQRLMMQQQAAAQRAAQQRAAEAAAAADCPPCDCDNELHDHAVTEATASDQEATDAE